MKKLRAGLGITKRQFLTIKIFSQNLKYIPVVVSFPGSEIDWVQFHRVKPLIYILPLY